MDKYIIAPPAGSTNNAIGANDRKWAKGYFDELPGWQDYLAEATGYGVVRGCNPSITGLVVSVGNGLLHMYTGQRKEFAAATVTLDAANPTDPRIDLVYLDEDGALQKSTGTAAESPLPPALPDNAIAVCTVTVEAAASTGTILDCRGIKYRQPNTTYAEKAIAFCVGLPTGWYLEVGTAGETSNAGIALPSPVVENLTVNDGTVVWKIRRLSDITQFENELGGKVDKADCPANGITNNSIYRGKDLTAYFESGQMSADMATGKWDNIFVGDYIIKSVTINGVTCANVKWIIMHTNYHLHCGDTETTQNHVVLMPEEQLGTRQMNPTDTTAGGYVGSAMWTTHMPLVVAGIEAAFGADHVLAHRELLTNAMNGDLISANWTAARGAASGWAWVTAKANLATEEMVYGAPIWSSSAHDSSGDTMQLAAFKLNRGLICSKRYWWWLRAVAHASRFCLADGDGRALNAAASFSGGGVRPYFLLH